MRICAGEEAVVTDMQGQVVRVIQGGAQSDRKASRIGLVCQSDRISVKSDRILVGIGSDSDRDRIGIRSGSDRLDRFVDRIGSERVADLIGSDIDSRSDRIGSADSTKHI